MVAIKQCKQIAVVAATMAARSWYLFLKKYITM